MDAADVLKIFVPHRYLEVESGLLLGWKDASKALNCVTYVVHTSCNNHKDMFEYVQKLQQTTRTHIQILGLWISTTKNMEHEYEIYGRDLTSYLGHCWFVLHKCEDGPPRIVLGQKWQNTYGNDNVMVIVFNATLLTRSYFLMDTAYKTNNEAQKTNLASVAKGLVAYEEEIQHDSVLDHKWKKTDYTEHKHFVLYLFLKILYVVQMAFNLGIILASKCFSNRIFSNPVSNAVFDIPTTVLQLKTRYLDLKKAIHAKNFSPECKLRYVNAVSRHLVDVMLGVLMMIYLLQGDTTHHIATYLINWAENVASQLQQLLHWMMGAPAGLKLNHHLDQFLGNFFLYHIYLWTGYLHFLKPVLGQALWYISLAGCMGVSAQLSLVQDLLSMLTLHIYCFYVYAARLYSLQVTGLASLWRLFRGKKWNVLRNRVDSASYDVDQLFIGTLLFTILLFLLPTTALYYVIFTGLRLVVLSIQGVLHKVAGIINSFPIFAVGLWLVSTDYITDSVKFHVYPKMENRPLFLAMQAIPASLMTVLTRCAGPSNETGYTWQLFCKKLLQGHLIYPWIEQARSI